MLTGIIALAGALVALRAVLIRIRDSQDHFISDLHRQGRWASWAALLACIASIIGVVAELLGR